jgi:hypothetical protein
MPTHTFRFGDVVVTAEIPDGFPAPKLDIRWSSLCVADTIALCERAGGIETFAEANATYGFIDKRLVDELGGRAEMTIHVTDDDVQRPLHPGMALVAKAQKAKLDEINAEVHSTA